MEQHWIGKLHREVDYKLSQQNSLVIKGGWSKQNTQVLLFRLNTRSKTALPQIPTTWQLTSISITYLDIHNMAMPTVATVFRTPATANGACVTKQVNSTCVISLQGERVKNMYSKDGQGTK